jgi:hypothetical protein
VKTPTPEMFAEYRAPDDPRRKELDKRIALAWLALRNAERNGKWARASQLAGTILMLERDLAAVRVDRVVWAVDEKPAMSLTSRLTSRFRRKLPRRPLQS